MDSFSCKRDILASGIFIENSLNERHFTYDPQVDFSIQRKNLKNIPVSVGNIYGRRGERAVNEFIYTKYIQIFKKITDERWSIRQCNSYLHKYIRDNIGTLNDSNIKLQNFLEFNQENPSLFTVEDMLKNNEQLALLRKVLAPDEYFIFTSVYSSVLDAITQVVKLPIGVNTQLQAIDYLNNKILNNEIKECVSSKTELMNITFSHMINLLVYYTGVVYNYQDFRLLWNTTPRNYRAVAIIILIINLLISFNFSKVEARLQWFDTILDTDRLLGRDVNSVKYTYSTISNQTRHLIDYLVISPDYFNSLFDALGILLHPKHKITKCLAGLNSTFIEFDKILLDTKILSILTNFIPEEDFITKEDKHKYTIFFDYFYKEFSLLRSQILHLYHIEAIARAIDSYVTQVLDTVLFDATMKFDELSSEDQLKVTTCFYVYK